MIGHETTAVEYRSKVKRGLSKKARLKFAKRAQIDSVRHPATVYIKRIGFAGYEAATNSDALASAFFENRYLFQQMAKQIFPALVEAENFDEST